MMVPVWNKVGDYDKIVEYIEMETREFVKFNVWLYKRMPLLLKEWFGSLGMTED